MLLFSAPPFGPDAQPLLSGVTTFRDHLKTELAYYLPPALSLLSSASGDPDFFLMRYHGDSAVAEGGLLRFRLGFGPLSESLRQTATAAGWQLREAAFEPARFRLRLRSLQDGQPDQLGDWHRLTPVGRELVAPAVSLNSRETQFLEGLLAEAANIVEVELDLRYSGLVPGLPWLVSAQTTALKTLLAALLPPGPVRSDQIIAAFLSLPEGNANPLTFQPLENGATMPDRDAILGEVAVRSLGGLLERQSGVDEFAPATYQLEPAAPTDPPSIAWDLLPSRQESRAYALNWAVSSFVHSFDTPEERRKLFPAVSEVSPFTEVDVHVISHVPYDPRFLRKAVVDLRYRNPTGVSEIRSFSFDGTVDVQSFRTYYPTAADFQLDYRITTTQSPPGGIGWPTVRKGAYVPADGLVVEVNRATIGMDFVRVECDPEVFSKAASVKVALFSSDPAKPETAARPLFELDTTSICPAAWVALPGVDPSANLYLRAVAHGPGDPEPLPVVLDSGPVLNRYVHIPEYRVEVLDSDRVTIYLDPDLADRFAVVRVTVAPFSGDGFTYTLQPAKPVLWNFFRDSIFASLRYRYRLDYVAIDPGGGTQPMASTDWLPAQEVTLLISPPIGTLEVHV
jgi:hypothetical protein